ncbi:conserved protein of unknown function [Tenacibaculum sp. 190130A14a]|uniref:Histidine kinase/DNA gyrase B/HSP90-like ATPase n=1 Tax=Tenacibaculum polynesiense TaxID=3137857 RepID=A0ABP1EZ73_9FLAO
MNGIEVIEQKVHFKGLISSIDIRPEEYLLPLQEVVVNSIQSIIDNDNINDGKIVISIKRLNESKLNFGEEDIEEKHNPIIGFSVRDNGIGFINNRFDAFRTPYTDYGATKHGCKGIGRYTVLACFGSMDIDSYYLENKTTLRRVLRFDNSKGLQKVNIDSNSKVPSEIYTQIELNNYKEQYAKYINTNKVSKKDIAEGIIQHCLLYFLNKTVPTIYLLDDGESIEEALVLNDIYRTVIDIADTQKNVQLSDLDREFTLNYIKNYNGVQSHSIHLCANNRQVGDKKTLTKYIPSFKELHDDENKKFHISLYVTSEFLDEKALPQRNRFSFPDKDDKLQEHDGISLEGLCKGLANKVKDTYSDFIKEAEKEKNVRIKSYILDEKKPRLRYKHLLSIENAFNDIPINASDDLLEARLHEVSFKLEQKREKAFNKLFKKRKYDKDEFGKIVHNVLREEASFSKDKLADLMIKRKSIIKLFKKYLEWRDEGNYMLEEDLHNIIFTMGADTNSMPDDYHNLWLLDERLTFHSFTASDKQLRSNTELESSSQREPDLFIYDVPMAYSDNPNNINSMVLFEFKRPGRDMNTTNDKRLDYQLDMYFEKLGESKAKNSKGNYINLEDETPKFGYIVCDLHKDLINYNIKRNGFKKTPHGTLYKVNPELNLYFEVIDYNHLVDFAEKRHDVFFKALGINNL